MINSTTPYKLAEIVRDTWPQLFYLRNQKEETENKYTYNKDQLNGSSKY